MEAQVSLTVAFSSSAFFGLLFLIFPFDNMVCEARFFSIMFFLSTLLLSVAGKCIWLRSQMHLPATLKSRVDKKT